MLHFLIDKNSYEVIEEDDGTFTVIITPPDRDITVDVDEDGEVTVTLPPIFEDTDYDYTVDDDGTITIIITPGPDDDFDEDDITVNIPPDWAYEVEEDDEGNIVIIVTPNAVQLTIQNVPAGTRTIGQTQSGSHLVGATVNINAGRAPGYTFLGWVYLGQFNPMPQPGFGLNIEMFEGAVLTPEHSFRITENVTWIAVWGCEEGYIGTPPDREITVDVDDEGNTTVTLPPVFEDTDYEIYEDEDGTIIVTITPGPDDDFDEDDITVNVPPHWDYEIIEEDDGTFTVIITPPGRDITIDVDDEGNHVVTLPPIFEDTDYDYTVNEDGTITIVITPGPDDDFDEDDITVNLPPHWEYEVIEEDDGTLTVIITPPDGIITVEVDEEDNPVVTIPPIFGDTDYEYTVNEDGTITIVITPGPDDDVTEDDVSVALPPHWDYEVTTDDAGNVIVTLIPPNRDITVDVDDEGEVTVTLPPIFEDTDYDYTVNEDGTITIVITPGPDDDFDGDDITVNLPPNWDYEVIEEDDGTFTVIITPPVSMITVRFIRNYPAGDRTVLNELTQVIPRGSFARDAGDPSSLVQPFEIPLPVIFAPELPKVEYEYEDYADEDTADVDDDAKADEDAAYADDGAKADEDAADADEDAKADEDAADADDDAKADEDAADASDDAATAEEDAATEDYTAYSPYGSEQYEQYEGTDDQAVLGIQAVIEMVEVSLEGRFLHWSLTPGGPRFNFELQALYEDTYLYAVWADEIIEQPHEYIITFLRGDGTMDIHRVVEVIRGNAIPVIDNPLRNNHTFAGWTLLGVPSNPVGQIPTGNMTFVATWTVNAPEPPIVPPPSDPGTTAPPGPGAPAPGVTTPPPPGNIVVDVDNDGNTTVTVPGGEYEVTEDEDGNIVVVVPDAEDRNFRVNVPDGWTYSHEREADGTLRITIVAPSGPDVGAIFDEAHNAFLVGSPDGRVRPHDSITRAEVVTVLFRLLNDEFRASNWSQHNNFTDVSSNAWFNNAISTLANAGIIHGGAGGEFRPNDAVTRAEFAAMVARFFTGFEANPGNFRDIEGNWAADYINLIAQFGWVQGDGAEAFNPNANMSRAEAAAIVNRMLGRTLNSTADLLEGRTRWPDKTNVNAWYYLYMQEATHSTHFERLANGNIRWTEILPHLDWTVLERPESFPGAIATARVARQAAS